MRAVTSSLFAAAVVAALLAGCAQTISPAPAGSAAAPVAAAVKSVPGDAAIPIVELMPLTTRHEVDLNLTTEQIQALDAYRKANMPARLKGQAQLLALRGELRAAILEARPTARLMQQVTEAELAHLQARERCAEFMRRTLTPVQYARLTRLYLDGLR